MDYAVCCRAAGTVLTLLDNSGRCQ